MGKNKYTYSYSKLVHNIPKPKQKAFAGAMTSIVKYVAENMVDIIRFRSVSGDQGTVSSVKIQGAKEMIYASCQPDGELDIASIHNLLQALILPYFQKDSIGAPR